VHGRRIQVLPARLAISRLHALVNRLLALQCLLVFLPAGPTKLLVPPGRMALS
jgi:hypothetical protein